MIKIIKKCDDLWGIRVKEKPVIKIHEGFGPIDPHHILPKSVYIHFRHDLNNGIPLFRSDHSWAEVNPEEFLDWLEMNWPKEYQWHLDHKDDKRLVEVDYKEIYEKLEKA